MTIFSTDGGSHTRIELVSKEHAKQIAIHSLGALVLTDNLWSFMSWRIKRHTHGRYQHVMWLAGGQLYSQEWVLLRRGMSEFLNGNHRVKIITCTEWPEQRLKQARRLMDRKMRRPWWERLYDPLGILGQRLRLTWLQLPWLDYCSESVASVLNKIDQRFSNSHPSPADLNQVAQCLPDAKQYVYDPELSGDYG